MEPSRLLRRARESAALSQRQLADAAGTSGPTVAAYETGTKRPRSDTLLRLLAATDSELELRAARSRSERFVDLLCERVAERVSDDREMVDDALRILDDPRYQSPYREAWEQLLRAGAMAVIGVLTSSSPHVRPLKTDNPFAFLDVIDDEERAELLARARAA